MWNNCLFHVFIGAVMTKNNAREVMLSLGGGFAAAASLGAVVPPAVPAIRVPRANFTATLSPSLSVSSMESVVNKTMKQDRVRKIVECGLLDADRVALVSKRLRELQLRVQELRKRESQISVK